jgi:two-component system OmpR family sensor kinase
VGTASTTTETEGIPLTTRITASPLGRHLIGVWTVWALCCLALMVLLPGHDSIPYHLGWVGFALAFGFGTWSRRQLVTSLTWYTLGTGAVLVRNYLHGHIGWDETTEIPLMCLLAVLIAWHVRRSRTAQTQVSKLAERNVEASRDSARLMQARSLEDLQDLSVVAEELARLAQVSDRLIRMLKLQEDRTREIVDVDHVMAQSVERWRVVTDRRWVLDADAGDAVGSAERLRTCLDTLVENAIRYTSVGDTIRLVGSRQDQHVIVSVFDSGVGLSDQQILAINAGEASALTETSVSTDPALDMEPDHLAGTGLGLSIVRQAAHARGGTLHATHAPEGGAGLTLTYPLDQPGEVERR